MTMVVHMPLGLLPLSFKSLTSFTFQSFASALFESSGIRLGETSFESILEVS